MRPTIGEAIVGFAVGVERQRRAVARGSKSAWAYDHALHGYYTHVLGALAECMFARARDLYWPMGIDVFGVPDVPPDWQVRANSLKVAAKDADTWRVAFMVAREAPTDPGEEAARAFLHRVRSGWGPDFTDEGWIGAAEARSLVAPSDPGDRGRPAWFVTRAMLHPYAAAIDEPYDPFAA